MGILNVGTLEVFKRNLNKNGIPPPIFFFAHSVGGQLVMIKKSNHLKIHRALFENQGGATHGTMQATSVGFVIEIGRGTNYEVICEIFSPLGQLLQEK